MPHRPLASQIVDEVLNELMQPEVGADEKTGIILRVEAALMAGTNAKDARDLARRLLESLS